MKKSKLISIFLLILIALFATGYTKKTTDSTGSTGKESGDAIENVKGSLMDVIKLGKSVKCTGSYSSADGNMEMTVYAAGKKSYSEMIISTQEGGTFKTYSIMDGEWMYSWTDMEGMPEEAAAFMSMATKMKVSDMEELAADMPNADDYKAGAQEKTQAFQKEFDYKCKAWIPDNSKFTPPSDIEFSDITQSMKDLKESMESGDLKDIMDAGCKNCDLLPDATAKAECKANLDCE